MNLNFKFKPMFHKSGNASYQPIVTFEENPDEKVLLVQFLTESDSDWAFQELFKVLDRWEDLPENEHWNTDIWYLEKNEDGTVTIHDMHDDEEDDPDVHICPPVTLTIPELRAVWSEYRTKAKAFRKIVQQFEKDLAKINK